MPGGKGNIRPEDGIPFTSETGRAAGRKGGKAVSIRRQLKDLLDKDGLLVIPAAQIIETKKDGSVLVNLPTQDKVAMQVIRWAMSGDFRASLPALKMLIEQIDGKPMQEHQISTKERQLTEAEEAEEIKRYEKALGYAKDTTGKSRATKPVKRTRTAKGKK